MAYTKRKSFWKIEIFLMLNSNLYVISNECLRKWNTGDHYAIMWNATHQTGGRERARSTIASVLYTTISWWSHDDIIIRSPQTNYDIIIISRQSQHHRRRHHHRHRHRHHCHRSSQVAQAGKQVPALLRMLLLLLLVVFSRIKWSSSFRGKRAWWRRDDLENES